MKVIDKTGDKTPSDVATLDERKAVVTRTLGENIRDERLRRKLTQQQLAKGVCTASMVSQIEAGKANPSYTMLCMIASRLQVSVDRLYKGVDITMGFISRYKLARALRASGNYEMAIDLFKTIEKDVEAGETSYYSNYEVLQEFGVCLLSAGELEQAYEKLITAHDLAIQAGDVQSAFRCLLEVGKIFIRKSQFTIAAYHTQKAREILVKHGILDPDLQSKAISQQAMICQETGKIYQARKMYEEALALVGDSDSDIGVSYLQLAELCYKQKDYVSAGTYASKAFEYLNGEEADKSRLEWKMRLILMSESEATVKIEQLMHLAKQLEGNGRKGSLGAVYAEIAQRYFENKHRSYAWEYAMKAQSLLEGDSLSLALVLRILAYLHFEGEDFNKGKPFIEESIRIFTSLGLLSDLEETVNKYSDCLKERGEHVEGLLQLQKINLVLYARIQDRGIR